MNDPVSSVAPAGVAFKHAGVSGERAFGDPLFLQLLEALLGPVNGADELLNRSLQGALSAAVNGGAPGGEPVEDLPTALCWDGDAPPGSITLPGKDENGNPVASVEAALALLTAAVGHLQPWQVTALANGAATMEEASGSTTVEASSGDVVGGLLALSPGERWALLKNTLTSQGLQGPEANMPHTQGNMPRLNGSPSAADQSPERALGALRDELAAGGIGSSPSATGPAAIGVDGLPHAEHPESSRGSHETDSGGLSLFPTIEGLEGGPYKTKRGGAGETARVQLEAELAVGHSPISGPAGPSKASSLPASGQEVSDGNTSHDDSGGLQATPVGGGLSRPDRAMAGSVHMAQHPRGEERAASLLNASVVEQIASRAQLISARSRTGLSLQLEPKELGKVRVYIGVGPDGLHVRLAAEGRDTMGIIQASLPQLKEALENQGLRVDRFDVGMGSGLPSFNSSQDGWQRQGMGSGQAATPYWWDREIAAEEGSRPEMTLADSLIDYRI